MLVVDVEDIDATLKEVKWLGGSTIVGRQTDGDIGFSTCFTDSAGNATGLWQNA